MSGSLRVLSHCCRPILRLSGAVVGCLLASGPGLASDNAHSTAAAVAIRVTEPPVLDGSVLDDPAWTAAEPVHSFWQTTPDEGKPASERTEVRIVYTPETLYFGVVCYDREPKKIVVTEGRRDSPLDETDSFQIILDTYLDRQNGFVFGTNPAGIEYDGQVSNEGQGGGEGRVRQQGSAGGGFNINWDSSWQVKTRIGDFGWSAELAIPFRSLRYRGRGLQTWGLNFQRNIRRRNETAFWAPLPRQFNLYRLSAAGTLRGITLPNQRNLKLVPYVLGQTQRDFLRDRKSDWSADSGLDVKYSLTSSLTLDATINTDFAQVEVDEQQINLDRFNLFFPEKRPFFLENAGLFAVGSPGEVDLFFSRRIGIGPDGEMVPIVAGARLSGKFRGTNVGLLDMQTESAGGRVPANNFMVARVSRELSNRSHLGAMFVNRQSTGGPEQRDHNRTYALDGRWGIGKYGQISGFVARTSTPGIRKKDHGLQLWTSYDSQAWTVDFKYTEVGEGFNPEVGFLSRRGFQKPHLLILHRYRPTGFLGFQELRPHLSYRGYWKPGGFQESGLMHLDTHWEWKNGYEIRTAVNFTREGVRTPFEIFPGVAVHPGIYDHREVELTAVTNQGAPLSMSTELVVGGFFGGDRISLRPSVKLRVSDTISTDIGWQRDDIELPGGSFVTNLLRVRTSYSFTPRVFAQALVQYNDRTDRWSSNLRFGWLEAANTGLFVVYNENRETVAGAVGLRDRSLIVKYSRLVDLLD